MQIVPIAISPVRSQVCDSERDHGIPCQRWPNREGLLLRRLPLHVAEGRKQAFETAAAHGALLLHRRDRAETPRSRGGQTARGLAATWLWPPGRVCHTLVSVLRCRRVCRKPIATPG